MKTPWINYKEMQKINRKQQKVFSSLHALDFQHLNKENTENSDDIRESDNKTSLIDAVDIENLGENSIASKNKGMSKSQRNYRHPTKINLYETDNIYEDHIDATHHVNEVEDVLEGEPVAKPNFDVQTEAVVELGAASKSDPDIQTGVVVEGDSVAKPNFDLQTDVVVEGDSASEPDLDIQTEAVSEQEVVSGPEDNLIDGIKCTRETNNVDETSYANEFHKSAGVRSMTLKIPISTFAEIDNFLHPPIFGSTIQNEFKFIDPYNKQIPQLDTKIFDNITYYHEQPYCHLIGFKSHELIFSTDPDPDHTHRANVKEENDYYPSVLLPIHDPLSIKTSETNNNTCPAHEPVYIRVPVVIGEYNIEICFEKDVLFEEKVYKVKEISKEVVLTNCKFVPAGFSDSTADGIRKALRGKLFIEGYVYQSIEYITANNGDDKSVPKELEIFYHILQQKIVLNLMVQLLQVQKVTTGQKEI